MLWSNMFYTVTLPCTLWFLDRGKTKTSRADTVLFIDARHVYRQIDRAHNVFGTHSRTLDADCQMIRTKVSLLYRVPNDVVAKKR